MNFFRKLFNLPSYDTKEIEKQEVNLSLDDLFVHNFLEKVPTPIAGLALGISGLGWCAENALPANHGLQIASAIIAGILLLNHCDHE